MAKTLTKNSVYYEMIGETQKESLDLDNEFSIKLSDLRKMNSFWFKNFFKEN